jgi:hypothetical protein
MTVDKINISRKVNKQIIVIIEGSIGIFNQISLSKILTYTSTNYTGQMLYNLFFVI